MFRSLVHLIRTQIRNDRDTDKSPRVADPGYNLDEARLLRSAWSFQDANGSVVAPHVTFELEGFLGGIDDARFSEWSLSHGLLRFIDDASAVSFSADLAFPCAAGVLKLNCKLLTKEFESFYLVETERLTFRPKLAEAERLSKIMPRRRNLVVLSANASSLHSSWNVDIVASDRNWDLCLSWYGDEKSFRERPPSEYAVMQKGSKWHCLHRLCYDGSPLFDYEYIAFPDDDLVMTWRQLNRMFNIARQYGLELFQPSLSAGSFISHPITTQQPGKLLRFTNFVEVMTPVFSRSALSRCCGTFCIGKSGWGLDNIWPLVLGGHRHRIAIIDAVGIQHTRPVGKNYDTSTASAEAEEICRSFGVSRSYQEFGCLT